MKKTGIANFGFIAFCVLMISAQLSSSVLSADTFQNNLLKADIYKSPVGGLKITLFTSKPYKDAVIVNKKSDLEYVILMPETSNSMTAKPSLKFVNDSVKAVDIKTQQYANQVKGYTKIIISTTKPVEISSQVQTLRTTDYKLGEKDYKELLAQTVKHKANSAQRQIAKSLPKSVSKPIQAKAPVKNAAEKKSAQVASSGAAASHSSKPVVSKQLTSKNPKVAVTPKVTSSPAQTKEPVVKNTETPQIEKEQQTQTVAPQQVQSEPQVPNTVSTDSAKKVVEVNNAFTLKHIKRIIKNNLYTLVGAFFAMFLLLLLIARKINRNNDRQKENFSNHLDEKPPVVTNYEENITDDMTWKEKFQTYVDTSQNQQEPSAPAAPTEFAQSNPELDGLFSEEILDEETKEEGKPLQEDAFEKISEAEPIANDEFDEISASFEQGLGYQDASLEDLFGDDEEIDTVIENEIDEEISHGFDEDVNFEQIDESQNEDEFVQSEFVIDSEKGFYLVDYENATALVGHIGEEIFVLKQFGNKVYGPIQARLDENKGSSASFMTKVGDFRALVEVTPEKMNLLIEL